MNIQNTVRRWALIGVALLCAAAAQAQQATVVPPVSQAYVDDIVLLPVDCFLVVPLSGKGGQRCQDKGKVVQLQSTQARYALLDRYNINAPYDVIAKQCVNLSKHYQLGLLFWCHNRQENWSIQFQYYFQSHPAANLLHLASIELVTCASADAAASLNAVARKFGKPREVDADDARLVYQQNLQEERMTVVHRQTIPGVARLQDNSGGNAMFSCPGNTHLAFKLESRQFQSGRAAVLQKIQADQGRGSVPKF